MGTGRLGSICRSTCDALFQACKGEFFSAQNVASEPMMPCTGDSLLCSPLSYFAGSGTELCAALGFKVGEELCYDGVADATAVGVKDKSAPPSSTKDSAEASLRRLVERKLRRFVRSSPLLSQLAAASQTTQLTVLAVTLLVTVGVTLRVAAVCYRWMSPKPGGRRLGSSRDHFD